MSGTLLDAPLTEAPLAVVDLEMTGLDPNQDRICEVGIVRATGRRVERRFETLVAPGVPMTQGARQVHGIRHEDLTEAPRFAEVAHRVEALLEGAALVGHNVAFDLSFLRPELAAAGRAVPEGPALDTLLMARRLFAFERNDLETVCTALDVPRPVAHRALADAGQTFAVLWRMIDLLDPAGTWTLGDLLGKIEDLSPDSTLRRSQEQLLERCMRERRTVTIVYQSNRDGPYNPVPRRVSLWKVRFPLIQGFCHLRGAERVFHLSRVHAVIPTDEPYQVPPFEARI